MVFDVRSLLIALMINVITVAGVLTVVMGQVTLAGRRAQQGAGLQAAGWLCLLCSSLYRGTVADQFLSCVAVTCLATSLICLSQAFAQWGGRSTMPRWPWSLALATVAGYALGFHHYAWRVGWANTGLTVLMLLVVQSLWRQPPGHQRSNWRGVVAAFMVMQAAVTLWRGMLGAFFTADYPTFLSPHPVNVASVLIANVTAVLTLVGILLAMREESDRQLQRLATVDGLTGLLNRRAWMERAQDAHAMSLRHQHPLSILMLDLDHFKQINDTRGHGVGDRALKVFGQAITEVLRAGDIAGRLGGEEFGVLLIHATHDDAMVFDRRVRERIAQLAPEVLGLTLNYSAGLAQRHGSTATLEALLHEADLALYAAKAQGRGLTI